MAIVHMVRSRNHVQSLKEMSYRIASLGDRLPEGMVKGDIRRGPEGHAKTEKVGAPRRPGWQQKKSDRLRTNRYPHLAL